jgi:error-prone DNA polymerase
VLVGGVVTHRQRPATASGITFLNLEDETGLINVVVSRGCWTHHRHVALTAPAMVVRGRLEASRASSTWWPSASSRCPLPAPTRSRDFR